MLSGNALRHQIILPQQQKFYDYWRSKCRAGSFPSRSDILPEDIQAQLPMTTIMERVEPENGGERRYRHRLAGTGYWKLYDCLLYTSPSPRDQRGSRMPSSA